MIEFAENANELIGTEYSLFFVNFKYELRIKFDIMKISDPQSV